MRPLRLEIQGFTSFRERVCLDFEGLDLFAITGPTGAGKSSLVDAMVFALYGLVPRVGNQYAQLLSHGAERLSVCLDFTVGGEHYRVARTLRASGPPQTRLERIRGGEVEPLADRVKETAEHVERLLGLDYDGFVRAVVLPQGQFDSFLRGEPKERRKILVSLLRLGAYERMQEAANRRAADSRREAEFIAGQLQQDYADATEEALSGKRREEAAARKACLEAEKLVGLLDRAGEATAAVRTAARELQQASRSMAEEARRGTEAAGRHARATARLASLEAELHALAGRLAASGGDDARLAALSGAAPLAARWEELQARRATSARRLEDCGKAMEKDASALRVAEEAVPRAEAALARARTAVEVARRAQEALVHRHAAHALRQVLAPGEECPVCTQTVAVVPEAGELGDLSDAAKRLQAAEREAEAAQKAVASAGVAAERLRGVHKNSEAERQRLEDDLRETAAALTATTAALEAAGFASTREPRALVRAIDEELKQMQAARAERAGLEARRRALEQDQATARAEAAAAEAQSHEAEERRLAAERQTAACTTAQEAAAQELRDLCAASGLQAVIALAPGCEAEAIESARAEARRDLLEQTEEASRLATEAQAVEAGIARADALREKKKALDARYSLAQTLAQHLRADQFLAYVQEEAMRVLAADGTRHLKQLSQGRYSLTCEGQDFFVIDHWNADHRRSVKTLSGGETFLASLGLALALAESFVTLAADGAAGEALESLFLDEGFGTLDPETLGQVVRAIEELQGGSRLVGVITHIPELADQMPARIEVGRSDRGATLAVA